MNDSRDWASGARGRGGWASVALAALFACGGGSTARRATVRAALASPVAHLAPRPSGREVARAIVLPRFESPALVDREGATGFVTVGTLRAQLDGAGVRIGAQRTPAPIGASVRVAGGWAFVDDDGAVTTSTTFTGPLRVLGALATPVESEADARGVLAAIDRDGVAWIVADTTSLVRVATPGNARVLGIAFVDARHGAMALEGGALVHTIDGGASWTPVELGDAVAWRVTTASDQLLASTNQGIVAVAHDGTISDARPDADFAGELVLADAAVLRVRRAAYRAFAPVLAWTSADVAHTHDGALLAADGDAVVVFDGLTGQDVARHDGVLQGACELAPWGRNVLATCDYVLRLRSDDDGQSFAPLADAAELRGIEFDDDGSHAVLLDGCPAARRGRPLGALPAPLDLCVYHDERHAWRSLPITPAPSVFYYMHDGDVLVGLGGGADGAHALAVVSSETGVASPLPFTGDATNGRIASASFAADGTVSALVSRADAPHASVLAIGPPGAPLATRSTPADTRAVGFVDALRGVAAGADASQIYATLDGGRSWSRVEPAMRGAAARVALENRLIDCSTLGTAPACLIGDVVLVSFVRERTPWLDALGGVVTAATTPRASTDRAAPAGTIACRVARRGEPAVLAHVASTAVAQIRELAGVGVHAAIVVRRDGRGGLRVRARWRDDGGEYAASTRDGPFAATEPDDDFDAEFRPDYTLASATSRGLFFRRCSQRAHRSVACVAYWARADGPVVQVEFAGTIAGADAASRIASVVPRSDGGLLVLVSSPDSGRVVDSVVSLDARGDVIGQRAFAWEIDSPRVRGLGHWRDEAGYFATDAAAHDAVWFYRLERDPRAPPDRLALHASPAIAPCRSERSAPGDATLDVREGPWLPALEIEAAPTRADDAQPPGYLHATLEHADDGTMCVRRLRRDSGLRDDAGSGRGAALSLRAVHGVLVGAVDHASDRARDALTCQPRR